MKKQITTVLIAVMLLSATTIIAQAPQGFNYQAVIRNSSGDLIKNSIVFLRFTVMKTSASGTTVYQEDQTKTTSEYGSVSVVIGDGTVISGSFSDIDWSDFKHYLKVEVDAGSGFSDLGTTQIVSVPYALNSETADVAKTSLDSKWSSAGNDIFNNNSRVGIGTSSFGEGEKLAISDGTTKFGIYPGYLDNTPNPDWTTFEMPGSGNLRIWDGLSVVDNVGIGTTEPLAKLHVSTSNNLDQFIARIENTANDENAYCDGLDITAGDNVNGNQSYHIGFKRPDGFLIGTVSQPDANSVAYNTTSDRRLKTNIVDTKYGLNTVLNIQVKDYNFKDNLNQQKTGFIAQQLYEQYPEAVCKGGDDPKTRPWMVDYGKLTPVLVKAIQDQQIEIEALKKEIELLKAK